ncbi:MAG TPA: Pr6Pr family membrane protein [Acidimicrobiia bacterium]|nr:Pr6Pr family membrane protein [Acidimicrobiia bacterium]
MSETIIRAIRLALSSLLAVALLAALAIGMSRNEVSIVDFFSFFSVPSNALAVIALGMVAVRPRLISSRSFNVFRGGVTVYMSVTALLYAVLLLAKGIDAGSTEPWVDWSLHVIGPVAMVLDWLLDRPTVSIQQSAVGIWLTLPALYLGYTLIRGPIVDWYPYPFLDPAEMGGSVNLAIWLGAGLVVIVGLGYIYHWWANHGIEESA